MVAMSTKVAVIGAGSWGTALASLLSSNGHDTIIWSRGSEVAEHINKKHKNSVYLPNQKLHEKLRATSDLAEALDGAQFVIMVVPSLAMREIMTAAAPHIAKDAIVVSASKGIEDETSKTMFEVIEEAIGNGERIGVLSGPSFAAQVVQSDPTVVVAAATTQEVAEKIQQLFASDKFRVYSSTDVVGVEIGGVVKNVMAIATGVSDGLGYGHNARAATITRGLAEIRRLALKLGAKPETLMGLSGIGDLVLTCTGDLSRNRQLGIRIGRGESVEDILSGMRMVAEGVRNTKAVKLLAERENVEMPIVNLAYEVLYEGLPPAKALEKLFARELKPEF